MKTHEDLKAYLDGELTPEEAAAMEVRIQNDPELADEARWFRALGDGIREVAVVPLPHGGEQTVQKIRAPRKMLWPQVAALSAVSVLFAFVLFPVFAQSKSTAKTPATASAVAMANRMPRGIDPHLRPTGSVPQAAEAAAPPPPLDLGQASVESAKRSIQPPLDPRFRDDSREIRRDLGDRSAAGMTTAEAHTLLRPKLIRSANVAVRVRDALAASGDLQRSVESWGGYVLNSQVGTSEQMTQAVLDLRVPVDRFEEALRSIRGLGRVLSENSVGQDVTAQVIDSRTRVEVLADEEANLVRRLARATNPNEVAALRLQALRVRADLASWKAQARALDEMTKYSTLQVTLRQDGRGEGAWEHATGGLQAVGAVVRDALIYAAVFLPVWGPLALAAFLVLRRR